MPRGASMARQAVTGRQNIPTTTFLKVGTYAGDGLDNKAISGLGFTPSCVIIKDLTSGGGMVFKTYLMSGNNCLIIRDNTAFVTTSIKTLTSDGFTVGTSDFVNNSGRSYAYIAFRETPYTKVFSYTGNGVDDRTIDGINFQPDFVLIKANNLQTGCFRFSSAPADSTSVPFGGTNIANAIQTLTPSGFVVGTSTRVNESATDNHGFAFKEISGIIDVFSYTGNGVDDRNITTIGFEPEFVLLKANSSASTIYRTTQNSTGQSQPIDSTAVTNEIQGFLSNGFQVGSGTRSNADTVLVYGIAIKGNFKRGFAQGRVSV